MNEAKIVLVLTVLASLLCPPSAHALSPGQEKFLDKLSRDSFGYFMEETNPENGLIKDSSRLGAPCSVAVVGFGLTALCIGESNGWVSREEAYDRIVRILRTFTGKVPHEHGFFYHFLDMRTGKRAWNSEVSSIDTALFLAGALFAGQYFKDTEVDRLARFLYERVDWPWMMNSREVMCMGWKPETGFLMYYWDSYSEATILYALAIGSPTHPIEEKAWFAWKRPRDLYGEYEVVYSYFGSIFTYQYSHAWIDFRNLCDRAGGVNYHDNSVSATLANRQFCINNSDKHTGYGENSWGLTASLGPDGYRGYGARPGAAINDGTIAPCGMAGSLIFAEEECIKGLKHLYEKHRKFLYGKYGFKDAFNEDEGWWAEEYLGIDVGITLIMLENCKRGFVRKAFMGTDPIKSWAQKCFKIQEESKNI